MSELINNMAFIAPGSMAIVPANYKDQANQMLAEFAEEINELDGTVTIIFPVKGNWYFDFEDISSNLSDRIISRIESYPFGADRIKQYAIKKRGF